MPISVNICRWGNRKNAREKKNKEGIRYESDLRCVLQRKCNKVATFSKIFQEGTGLAGVFFKIFMLAAYSTLHTENPPLQGMLQTVLKVDDKSPKIRN